MHYDTAGHVPATPLSHAILLALADRSRHGYAIIKEVKRLTRGQLQPRTGTLYAALQRMESEGLIALAERDAPEDEDPRRRYFQLTRLGRHVARAESERLLSSLVAAIQKNLLGDVDLGALLSEGAG